MVNDNLSQAQVAIQQARASLKKGDKRNAYAWAKKAAQLSPELEDAWLILASVSNPKASIKFLSRALEINPTSQRAKKGMAWAERRMRPQGRQTTGDALSGQSKDPSAKRTKPIPKKKSRLPLILLGGFLIVCIIGAVILATNTSPAMALFSSAPTATASSTQQHWAQGTIAKPTYTPSPTATLTPTPTFTPTPTYTLTPTSTFTPTPTNTYTPTNTPLPTKTPNPTKTPKPAPPPPTAQSPSEIGGGEHWIEINLSEQRVYAYAGNTLINSFIVSTGTWQTPTVTGSYRVYVKYPSTRMTGPGYDLPNVPYVMYFYKGYGLHGTYWHNNFGTPMSHGCVNLRTSDAAWLYNFSSVGTLVRIHY